TRKIGGSDCATFAEERAGSRSRSLLAPYAKSLGRRQCQYIARDEGKASHQWQAAVSSARAVREGFPQFSQFWLVGCQSESAWPPEFCRTITRQNARSRDTAVWLDRNGPTANCWH